MKQRAGESILWFSLVVMNCDPMKRFKLFCSSFTYSEILEPKSYAFVRVVVLIEMSVVLIEE